MRRILLARRGLLFVTFDVWRRYMGDRCRVRRSLLMVRRLLTRLGTSTLASSWSVWMLWRVAMRQSRQQHEAGCRDAARDASMLLGRVARLADAELDAMVYEASMEHARVRMAHLERTARQHPFVSCSRLPASCAVPGPRRCTIENSCSFSRGRLCSNLFVT